ncbi:MAG TPA: rhodoquinone biosynthesis methyltransferase RquA [Usitatibacter sp.]|nr:rhodoquinone biosynthesis methyltransferase RquA [Usitatibacter sp.]
MQQATAIPQYLEDTYWWAYVHPNAVRFFERQWLVNLILWGNFAKLRDAALEALGTRLSGRTLQVACVYGDFTPRLAERIDADGRLDVVDVLPIQLANLQRKLPTGSRVNLLHRDASDLRIPDASYDRVALFFLLHEMPLEVRRRTLSEALRVVKPGGRVVIVDYHRPTRWHPFRPVMRFILRNFEPFAMDLWENEVSAWLPPLREGAVRKETFWGGLYQKLVITA